MIQDSILFVFILIALLITPLFGHYMAKIFQGKLGFPVLERKFFMLMRINELEEMDWKRYLKCLLGFNLIGFIFLMTLQLTQEYLPLNPQNLPNVPFWLAYNTASSFVTNTNWQAYSGEVTMSYLTQMLGLTVQNFLSAATGLVSLVVFIRGILGRSSNLGNFYQDVTRSIFYIFLPLSIILAVFLVYQGSIQNFFPYVEVTTLEGAKQTLPMGPAASQIAIKQLGTNGGGFFGVNSSHPFENPSYLTNFFQTVSIFFIPVACIFMYGYMIYKRREATTLFFVVAFLWIFGLTVADAFQKMPDKIYAVQPVLEGQEIRFMGFPSILWSVTTTATANGSINSMISSLSPVAGGIAMLNMMLGELIFGGVGVGMDSLLMYVLLTVFIAGLMVGRTPEYMGKKIEKTEMQWAMLAILAPSMLILIGAGICILLPDALKSLSQAGPHGFSELLYAFTSASANNGSAFAGLDANTALLNGVLGTIMILARLAILVPTFAVAGLLTHKKLIPTSAGTFRTNTRIFAILLVCLILIFAGLTFFPALTLGPILEQLSYMEGRTF